ncbi:MAG TPA: carbamoyltransferase HypF [Anaerolineaceae bacterium]
MTQSVVGRKIWVRGIVQGVGFRPFIYSLAARCQCTGWVRNTSSGVEIEINGTAEMIAAFEREVRQNPPPLAQIDAVESQPAPVNGYTNFVILSSQPREGDFLPVSPDVTICPDCRRELFNPADRRYRYPFINCTNCGPRFSIIRDIPYDRPKTSMAGFALCPDCQREYDNPLDRRFHAQPVACPACGPQVWFESQGQRLAECDAAIQQARQWLAQGKILAIKGLGGYHLACDAANPSAVEELRRRKKRSDKPFALMAFDLPAVECHCLVSAAERDLLESPQHPIVLLERKAESAVYGGCAPGQRTLGVMLPYTPLHLLLLEPTPGFPDMLVMTSGNLSEEPIAYEDADAKERLTPLVDGFLLHDRPIHIRVDDSVVSVAQGAPYLARRARGYAPNPVRLPLSTPRVLAAGAELKNTFCLTRDNYAFLSHHIGDLENYETLRSFEEGVQHFQRLFRVQPERIACDLHPNYLASRYARQRAQDEGLPLVEVQHHHAHLAAVLADNGWDSDEPVIGFCFDGTGYGTDGAIWGGEVLYGGYTGYQRFYHLRYVPLPGGDLAVRKPGRAALAHLTAAGLDWAAEYPAVENFCAEDRTAIRAQINLQLNAPLTSSMGRLFDAAAALIGVCQTATYEGQPAIELEALADREEMGYYPMQFTATEIDPALFWTALLDDWRAGVTTPRLAARVHNSIVRMVFETAGAVRQRTGCATAALSGGVWQNRLLLERSTRLLEQAGFIVLRHHQVPTNDGGVALGQALIAARMDIPAANLG